MKAVKAELQKTNPDRVATFEQEATVFAKKIVTNFKDFEFYTGESMNPDGMVALLNYRVGQGCAPIFATETDRTIFLPGGWRYSYVSLYPPWIDMILTSDHSLLHVLERWPEGNQALDHIHYHTLAVLHRYRRTGFICIRYTHSHSLVEFHGSKMRIDQSDVQTPAENHVPPSDRSKGSRGTGGNLRCGKEHTCKLIDRRSKTLEGAES